MIQKNQTTSSEPTKRKRSISAITNILLAVFIGLIVLLISVTYNQLKETETSFKTIAIKVLPTLANNGILHSQLSSLAFLVANFAQADSPAQVRISHAEVSAQFKEIDRLIASSNIEIENDLSLIRDEFNVLNSLIEERFSLQQDLFDGERQIYALQKTIKGLDPRKRYENTEILLSTLKLIHADKLIDVRNLQREMEAQLTNMTQTASASNVNDEAILKRVNDLVFAENGIIDSKLLLLRTKGRVEGQRSFVRRLVLDIASDAEFKAYEFANNQSNQAEALANRSSQQFSFTLITHLITFLIGLALIVFVKLRVVSRLETLTQSLSANVTPDKIEKLYRQNDEISILAHTIVDHIHTIDKQKAKLTELSFMDSLTKVGNRRAFNERLEQGVNLAMRNDLNLSVLLIDVDSFKQFNDQYGHVKGDECLYQVAQLLKEKAKRESDFIARYGGEEFVCLLIGMTATEAFNFAKQLCVSVEGLTIPHTHSIAATRFVTVSIGVHTETKVNAQSAERLLQCADIALYQAKTQGRNRAVQYLN